MIYASRNVQLYFTGVLLFYLTSVLVAQRSFPSSSLLSTYSSGATPIQDY